MNNATRLVLATFLSLSAGPLFAQNFTSVDHWGRGAYQAIFEHGQQLILAGDGLGLAVLELVDGKPVVRGEAAFPFPANESPFFNAVVAYETRAYAGGPSGLFVFDLTNPGQPRPLRRYPNYAVRGLVLSGQTLAMLLPSGVQLFDLGDPRLVPGDFLALTNPTGLTVVDSALWTIDDVGLSRFLLTGQGHGQLANQMAASGLSGAPEVDDTRLWAPHGSQLAIYDITDPSQPQLLGLEETGIQPIEQVLPTPDGLYVIGGDTGYGTCRFFEVIAGQYLVPFLRLHVMGARKGLARKDGQLVFSAPDNAIVVVEERLDDPPTLLAEGLFDGITDLAINHHFGFVADAQGVIGIYPDSVDQLTVSDPFGPNGAKVALDGDFLYAMRDGDLDIFDASDIEAPVSLATESIAPGDKLHIAQGKLGIVGPEGIFHYTLVNHLPFPGGRLGGRGDNRAIDFVGTRTNAAFRSEGETYFWANPSTFIALSGTGEVFDMASLGTRQFAVGDKLLYVAGGFWPTTRLEGVHSRNLESDGTHLWTDQLGQVNADLNNLVVRRFELPTNGKIAVSGDRALVQDGDHVGLYDLSTMVPAAVSGGPGPIVIRQLARQGHDLWLAAYTDGIYRLNDEDGALREGDPWNIGKPVCNVTVRDAVLYVQFFDELVAYDVADPAHPIELGSLEVYSSTGFKEFFVGDKLLANEGRLVLVDIQDPTDMKVHALTDWGEFGNAVQYGNLLYVTNYGSLCIYSADDLSYIGCSGGLGHESLLVISGQTLYGKEDNYISLYDLADPEHPTYLGSFATNNWGLDLFTDGTYLYNSGDVFYESPLEVYSLANPTQPLLVTSLPPGYVLSAEPDSLLVNPNIGNDYSLIRYDRTCTSAAAFLTTLPDWPNTDVKTLIQAAANLCGP